MHLKGRTTERETAKKKITFIPGRFKGVRKHIAEYKEEPEMLASEQQPGAAQLFRLRQLWGL